MFAVFIESMYSKSVMNHKMKVAEPIANEILNFKNDGDMWETCHGLALVSQGKDRNLPIFKKGRSLPIFAVQVSRKCVLRYLKYQISRNICLV